MRLPAWLVILSALACTERAASDLPLARRPSPAEAASAIAIRQADGLVGTTIPPIPAGFSDLGGSLIEPAKSWRWAVRQLRRDSASVLLLDSLTHRDERGVAYWRIVAVFALPARELNREIVMDLGCHFDGQPDASIYAIGVPSDSGAHVFDLERIRFAVRPNVAQQGFETLPADRVACWYDEDRR